MKCQTTDSSLTSLPPPTLPLLATSALCVNVCVCVYEKGTSNSATLSTFRPKLKAQLSTLERPRKSQILGSSLLCKCCVNVLLL